LETKVLQRDTIEEKRANILGSALSYGVSKDKKSYVPIFEFME
jgi:hypothetical protein